MNSFELNARLVKLISKTTITSAYNRILNVLSLAAALSVKRKQTYQITTLHITPLITITTLVSRSTCVLSIQRVWSERVYSKQWFSERQCYPLLYLGNILTRCARGFAWPKALTPQFTAAIQRGVASAVPTTNLTTRFHWEVRHQQQLSSFFAILHFHDYWCLDLFLDYLDNLVCVSSGLKYKKINKIYKENRSLNTFV